MADIKIYNYGKAILNPNQLRPYMDDKGTWSTLENNLDGIAAYINVLTEGSSKRGKPNASRTGKPLGNQYIIDTKGKCMDQNNKEQHRYSYVNNVPDSSLGRFRGIIPGMVGNLMKLDPTPVVRAFVDPLKPPCRAVQLQTIDLSNRVGRWRGHIADSEIRDIDPCAFTNRQNPLLTDENGKLLKAKTENQCNNRYDGFVVMTKTNAFDHQMIDNPVKDESNIPDDPLTNLYILSLSIFGMYIIKRVVERK